MQAARIHGMLGHQITVVLLAALLGLSACGGSSSGSGGDDTGDNGDGDNGDGIVDTEGEGLRFAHPMLDGPRLDLYIDGDKMTGLAVGYHNATEYFATDDGDNRFEGEVEVELFNEDDNPDQDAPYVSDTVELGPDIAMTAILDGTPADPELRIVDETNDGGTSVRISHFADDLANVDVYLAQDDQTSESVADLTPLMQDVGEGTVGEWIEVPSGFDNRLWLTEPGGDEIIFDSGEPSPGDSLSLSTGDHVHLVLTSRLTPGANDAGDRGLSDYGVIGLVESVTDTDPVEQFILDQRLRLQLINAVSDSGPVDIRIDDEAYIEGVDYQQGSELVEIVTGTQTGGSRRYEVIDPDTDAVLHDELVGLSKGHRYVVVLMGSEEEDDWILDHDFAASSQAQPLSGVEEDEITVQAAYAFHGYDDNVPSVDFALNATEEDSFPTVSSIAYQQVDSGILTPTLQEPGPDEGAFYEECCENADLVADFDIDGLEGQREYTFVMSGIFTGSSVDPDLFQVQAPWQGDLPWQKELE